jgi:hypothetical protein
MMGKWHSATAIGDGAESGGITRIRITMMAHKYTTYLKSRINPE